MIATIRSEREGPRARLVASGSFDLAHASSVAQAVEEAEPGLRGSASLDVDLGNLERIDGAGAVLLAQLIERLRASGCSVSIVDDGHSAAARLLGLYLDRRRESPAIAAAPPDPLTRIGALASEIPDRIRGMLAFVGAFAAAVPLAITRPRSVDWRSLPGLLQQIGADSLPVTSAANLLVGVIVGLLGVSQLGRFGAVSFVPELVVVAHFRELGPLVTAIVVAGRTGAGLSSELATMQVSEEIDALRTLGFDPMRWLVLPRCLALVVVVPLLAWIGDGLAVLGGMLATTVVSDMAPRLYLVATGNALTVGDLAAGLAKTPFLALAIGMIACAQGLGARGGAAAVGASTTAAVVMTIFAAIVISSVFTLGYSAAGI